MSMGAHRASQGLPGKTLEGRRYPYRGSHALDGGQKNPSGDTASSAQNTRRQPWAWTHLSGLEADGFQQGTGDVGLGAEPCMHAKGMHGHKHVSTPAPSACVPLPRAREPSMHSKHRRSAWLKPHDHSRPSTLHVWQPFHVHMHALQQHGFKVVQHGLWALCLPWKPAAHSRLCCTCCSKHGTP